MKYRVNNNPGKAGSDTAAEHRFVNQKIQNIKKRRLPIRNLNQKIQNLKKKRRLPARNLNQKPPLLKIEVGFFSDKKSFSLNG